MDRQIKFIQLKSQEETWLTLSNLTSIHTRTLTTMIILLSYTTLDLYYFTYYISISQLSCFYNYCLLFSSYIFVALTNIYNIFLFGVHLFFCCILSLFNLNILCLSFIYFNYSCYFITNHFLCAVHFSLILIKFQLPIHFFSCILITYIES